MEEIEQPIWLRCHEVVLAHGNQQVTPEPLCVQFHQPGITALVGKNGAGKSTFLNALLGNPVVQSGSIFLGGLPLTRFDRLAYVPQEPTFPPGLLLEDSLAIAFLKKQGWFGTLTPIQREARDHALLQFGLEDLRRRPLGKLSPGQRQRAFLARAFLQEPEILLLDEPTNHLDPEARHFFWSALQGIISLNACRVLVSTHDLSFVKAKASWVCALESGRVVYTAPSEGFWNIESVAQVFGEGPARDWLKGKLV